MGKLIVVRDDTVEGTDKHNVSGDATNPAAPPPTVPYVGIGEFKYVGAVTDDLSDFVTIDSKPVALTTSKSSLNSGESTSPTGKHSGPTGSSLTPPSPAPIRATLKITDQIGNGIPSATSGSSFVTVDGTPLLLDGDAIDTCDGVVATSNANSTVTASGQKFVSCSE